MILHAMTVSSSPDYCVPEILSSPSFKKEIVDRLRAL